MYIENINGPQDVKKLTVNEMRTLADEMRHALLIRASKHGGHFGPNFGMVEATIALHYVFNSPVDKFVYDVSHQSYVHKMLTGRKEAYINPEKFKTVAKGRDAVGSNENIIAIIGDGSLSGGEAYEGLNNAAASNKNIIILVNDNDISIAENHGGLYKNLAQLRESEGKLKILLVQ